MSPGRRLGPRVYAGGWTSPALHLLTCPASSVRDTWRVAANTGAHPIAHHCPQVLWRFCDVGGCVGRGEVAVHLEERAVFCVCRSGEASQRILHWKGEPRCVAMQLSAAAPSPFACPCLHRVLPGSILDTCSLSQASHETDHGCAMPSRVTPISSLCARKPRGTHLLTPSLRSHAATPVQRPPSRPGTGLVGGDDDHRGRRAAHQPQHRVQRHPEGETGVPAPVRAC